MVILKGFSLGGIIQPTEEAWAEAMEDCRKHFGDDAILIGAILAGTLDNTSNTITGRWAQNGCGIHNLADAVSNAYRNGRI
jgi:hypothetical protein